MERLKQKEFINKRGYIKTRHQQLRKKSQNIFQILGGKNLVPQGRGTLHIFINHYLPVRVLHQRRKGQNDPLLTEPNFQALCYKSHRFLNRLKVSNQSTIIKEQRISLNRFEGKHTKVLYIMQNHKFQVFIAPLKPYVKIQVQEFNEAHRKLLLTKKWRGSQETRALLKVRGVNIRCDERIINIVFGSQTLKVHYFSTQVLKSCRRGLGLVCPFAKLQSTFTACTRG